jgi:L-ascorbate metabolism protein UlaG (beta-lactamase superfamily)
MMNLFIKAAWLFAALLISGPALAQGKVQVQWFGQAAFKITTTTGKVIVIDPWLTSNPRTPEASKKLEALGPKVDLILATHAHFDYSADVPALVKMHTRRPGARPAWRSRWPSWA